jgi:CBS domain-containing protein
MFPVSDGDNLLGCVATRQVKEVPREQWSERTVSEVVEPCTGGNTVTSSTDAMQALAMMNRSGNSRLMVVDGGRLMGIITLKDLLRFFALKMDLEGEKQVNMGRQRGV